MRCPRRGRCEEISMHFIVAGTSSLAMVFAGQDVTFAGSQHRRCDICIEPLRLTCHNTRRHVTRSVPSGDWVDTPNHRRLHRGFIRQTLCSPRPTGPAGTRLATSPYMLLSHMTASSGLAWSEE
jgi:hypothetical protein